MFDNEVRALEQIDSAFTVKMKDYGECRHNDINVKYIVMEYIQGVELFDYVAGKGRLTESQAKDIFSQMLKSVKAVNQKGMVHRDLKLENFIIQKSTNKPILIDFGFACSDLGDNGIGFFENDFCGSTGYMAPEILE